MTAIIVGASSGLGRALAMELARSGHSLLLVASDLRDLEALASDLHLRHNVAIGTLALELAHEPNPGKRILEALYGLPPITALLLPLGYSCTDDDFSLKARAIGQILAINLHAPVAIVHALLPALLEAHGTVVGFGSVAAARGRGRNVVYASAKRGLASLFESLRQHHTSKQLRVHFYQLGFLRTNLTHGIALPIPAVDPAWVAHRVVKRLSKASDYWYLPRKWALIVTVIKLLPWWLYRRMKN